MNAVELWRTLQAARRFGREFLGSLYERMLMARVLEEKILDARGWHERGLRRIYYGIGQEAGPVAVAALLQKEDYLIPAYRGIAHVIAKGMPSQRVMAELLGRSAGPLRGLGNPGSFTDIEWGIFPNTDTLGTNFAVALGMGQGALHKNDDRIVCTFFGDGASTRSPLYGSLNASAIWHLPVLWVCENNRYSLATRYEATSETSVVEKARAFGLRAMNVYGNSIGKILPIAADLIDYVRAEKKPALLELETYRIVPASEADPYAYKNEKEWNAWKAQDPLKIFSEALAASRVFSPKELEEIRERVEREARRINGAALREPVLEEREIRAAYAVRERGNAAAPNLPVRPRSQKSFVAALRDALSHEMEKDPSLCVFGEDVASYGGRRGVTRGLLEAFGPRRVIDTPLNEELFVGMAIGAAQAGLRPVAEFSHAAFLMLAASDIHRMGFWDRVNLGKFKLPIVLRAAFGSGYEEYGEELALSAVSAFLNWKGIRMVAPSDAFQAKGLLTAALRSDTPTIFLEHRLLYKTEAAVPENEYVLPLGRGMITRPGNDVTVIAYGYLTHLAREAAEELQRKGGPDVEVVDLVSLKPLDAPLITASASKTKRVLILDEEPAGTAGLSAALFTLIKTAVPEARISFLGAEETPLPFGKRALAFLPDTEKIIAALTADF